MLELLFSERKPISCAEASRNCNPEPECTEGPAAVVAGAGGDVVAGGTDTVRCPVYHIVAQPGGIERIVEVKLPPESYYEALRADLGDRRNKVPWHVLDHLVSLEAFLDVSSMAGFF